MMKSSCHTIPLSVGAIDSFALFQFFMASSSGRNICFRISADKRGAGSGLRWVHKAGRINVRRLEPSGEDEHPEQDKHTRKEHRLESFQNLREP